MDALLLNSLGGHLYEYLLIVEPIDIVQKQIQAFKRYFSKSHRYPNAIISKGHLTLLRFMQYESYEERIVQKFQQLAASVSPFDIKLQDFGNFGHTLFIDVKSIHPILNVISARRQELRPLLNRVKGTAPHFVTKPHITIARNLTPSQTNTIWPIWKRTKYSGSFRAKNMTLLRRLAGTHSYEVVRKFNFLGMLPPFVQGKLFA